MLGACNGGAVRKIYYAVTRSKFWLTPVGSVLALLIAFGLAFVGIAALGSVGWLADWVWDRIG